MQKYLIRNINVVNEGKIDTADVLIAGERIERIGPQLTERKGQLEEINGEGKFLLPGVIDDQVHFREPGLTHKATIYTEAKAAVAGGVTSFMEMPNTVPPALTQALLEDKYAIAGRSSLANYSFLWALPMTMRKKYCAPTTKKEKFAELKSLWALPPAIYWWTISSAWI